MKSGEETARLLMCVHEMTQLPSIQGNIECFEMTDACVQQKLFYLCLSMR